MSLQMKYFVLKPKGDNPYARASRHAMATYAREIKFTDPDLAKELLEWANTESFLSVCEGESTDGEVKGASTVA